MVLWTSWTVGGNFGCPNFLKLLVMRLPVYHCACDGFGCFVSGAHDRHRLPILFLGLRIVAGACTVHRTSAIKRKTVWCSTGRDCMNPRTIFVFPFITLLKHALPYHHGVSPSRFTGGLFSYFRLQLLSEKSNFPA